MCGVFPKRYNERERRKGQAVETLEQSSPEAAPGPDRLEPGDHLDRATFHSRYAAMPADVRAELVQGKVHMPSPVQRRRGVPSADVVTWLNVYKAYTPGVQALDNATIKLADHGEPQPDACLLILPGHGGQSQVDEDDHVMGAPELVAEVASSTAAIDLFEKKHDYELAGVL